MARKRRGRGEGAIFQRSDGQWVARLSLGSGPDGKPKRKSLYGKTKAEVQAKLREMQQRSATGQLGDAGTLTVQQFLKRWLESKKGSVATHTLLPYERDCNRYLIPFIGGVKLNKVTATHVEGLYADLTKAGVSPAMQRKAGGTLRTALQHAVHPLRLIPHNPAADVPKPRHQPAEMQVLDLDQVSIFLDAAKVDRLYALYAVSIDSCAREGELFALAWNDVDFAGSAISITKSLEETKGHLELKETKNRKSRRRVALSAFAMEALAEHRKQMLAEGNYRPDGVVFCDTDGGWLRKSNVARRSLRPILAKADLPAIRFYDLRHTGATLLLLAEVPAKVVSERLGHSTTTQTLDTYSHVLPGMQERAASKLDAIFRAGERPAKAQ